MKQIELISQEPKCQIVTASKWLIDALLAMNSSNRKHKVSTSQRLATDILLGKFLLTASGIGVDRNGVLSDGQHRLYAIKAAGYPPVQFLLMTGLDPMAQSVVDRHAKRDLADALTLITGSATSKQEVAVSRSLIGIKGSTKKAESFISCRYGEISDSQTAATLVDWRDDIEAVSAVCGRDFRSPVVAALCVYYRSCPDSALELALQLKTGAEIAADSPAYRLRAKIAATKYGGSSAALESFKATASTCIAHYDRRPVKQLKSADSWAGAKWKWKIDEVAA